MPCYSFRLFPAYLPCRRCHIVPSHSTLSSPRLSLPLLLGSLLVYYQIPPCLLVFPIVLCLLLLALASRGQIVPTPTTAVYHGNLVFYFAAYIHRPVPIPNVGQVPSVERTVRGPRKLCTRPPTNLGSVPSNGLVPAPLPVRNFRT